MIIDRNWAKPSGGGGGDNTKLKEIIEGTVTEITAEDLAGTTKISDSAFRKKELLEKVALPSTIKSIEQYAFYDCAVLNTVTLNDGLESIGYYAFYDCDGLTSITIPDSVTSIDGYCFNSSGIKTIDWGSNPTIKEIRDSAFRSCKLEGVIDLPSSLLSIATGAFSSSLSNVTEFYVPDGLKRTTGAFNPTGIVSSNYPKLLKLYETVYYVPSKSNQYFLADCKQSTAEIQHISKDCKILGGGIFYNDTTLKEVVFEEGSELKTISDKAFYGCTNLLRIQIPNTTTEIGDSAFRGCANLTNISLDNIEKVPAYAFYGTGLENVILPESLTQIGANAFSYCSSMTSLTVNCTLNYEEASGAFLNLTNLTELNWNAEPWTYAKTMQMWNYAGSDGGGITLTVGDNVKKFYASSFGYLTVQTRPLITKVVLGNSIEEVNFGSYLDTIEEITLKSVIPPVLNWGIGYKNLQTIYIPAGTLSAYQTATNWSNFADKFVELPAE